MLLVLRAKSVLMGLAGWKHVLIFTAAATPVFWKSRCPRVSGLGWYCVMWMGVMCCYNVFHLFLYITMPTSLRMSEPFLVYMNPKSQSDLAKGREWYGCKDSIYKQIYSRLWEIGSVSSLEHEEVRCAYALLLKHLESSPIYNRD